jgi:hypothetical protein
MPFSNSLKGLAWARLANSDLTVIPLFLLMGQQPDLARDAGQFMRIAMWGLLPWLLQFVLRRIEVESVAAASTSRRACARRPTPAQSAGSGIRNGPATR